MNIKYEEIQEGYLNAIGEKGLLIKIYKAETRKVCV